MNITDVKTKEDARQYAFERMTRNIERLKRLQQIDDTEKREESEDYRQPLVIDKTYRLTIELSAGGDADGFILEYGKEKELIGGFYYWADWGQYEEIPLRMEEAELVEEIYLGGCGADFLG